MMRILRLLALVSGAPFKALPLPVGGLLDQRQLPLRIGEVAVEILLRSRDRMAMQKFIGQLRYPLWELRS